MRFLMALVVFFGLIWLILFLKPPLTPADRELDPSNIPRSLNQTILYKDETAWNSMI